MMQRNDKKLAQVEKIVLSGFFIIIWYKATAHWHIKLRKECITVAQAE